MENDYWDDETRNPWYDKYKNMNNKSTIIDDMLSDLVDDIPNNKKRSNSVKNCNIAMPDASGKIRLQRGCIFIAPTNTGFMLYTAPEGSVEIHCFSDIMELLKYLNDNKPLDLTQTEVAENI